MTRAFLLSASWFLAATALWLALLLLDIYWNLISWHLKWDGTVLILMAWMLAALAAIGLLTRWARDQISRTVSLASCLTLLCVGLHACPAEPLSAELFGRVASSPGWYRGLRAVLMSLPLVMWLLATWNTRRRKSD
jgi:hypothetical protein